MREENASQPNNVFNRKNIRAKFHDYSCGTYFVTICTSEREHFFGEIVNGNMCYTEIGRYAKECLESHYTHYNYVDIPLFVVMPNHIHAIIHIIPNAEVPKIRTALGVVIGGYKQAVTRFARRNNIRFEWQSRYHDHIIRNNRDGNNISQYIESNPGQWESDCFYGDK